MLKVNHLSKKFYYSEGERQIVDNLSFEVKKGQVVGFLGVNGAGKTTTLKMIIGLTKPDMGEITIAGQLADNPQSRQIVGFMPETPQFYRHLKVSEVLRYVGELFELDKDQINKQIDVLLRKVGLEQARNIPAHQLSKGMHQRLAFAVALINDPQLLILDEPLDGLDPVGRLDIKSLILDLKKHGQTIFFSSHILADVAEICDGIIILHNGKIVTQGTPQAIIGQSKKSLEQVFVEIIKKIPQKAVVKSVKAKKR